MPVESAIYIDTLVPTNPLGSDPVAAADDHIRLIKQTIKATFPNITAPVTRTADQMNQGSPAGIIVMWSGAIAAVPSGWSLCNGANGTPNLIDRFIVAAGSGYGVGATGGNSSLVLAESQMPYHQHGVTVSGNTAAIGDHAHVVADPGHAHSTFVRRTNKSGNTSGVYILSDPTIGEQLEGTANIPTNTVGTGIGIYGAGSHSHSISIGAATDFRGGNVAFDNRPAYYALAYIMKL